MLIRRNCNSSLAGGLVYIRDIRKEATELGVDTEEVLSDTELRKAVDDRKARDYFGSLVGLPPDSKWTVIINDELKCLGKKNTN